MSLCLNKPGMKTKDPQTLHVIGQLANLMLGKVLIQKYSALGSPVVSIHKADQLIKTPLFT